MTSGTEKYQTGNSKGFMATTAHGKSAEGAMLFSKFLLPILLILVLLVAGCSDDCIDCPTASDPIPAVPSGVFSVTGDELVSIYWIDIVYQEMGISEYSTPAEYRIYWRFYTAGDEDILDRTFSDEYYTVAWDENYDSTTGLHWYDDFDVVNGESYEYAVTAVSDEGIESAMSFELVHDTPLPMSGPGETETLFDADGVDGAQGGFDFSVAAEGGTGVVDPNNQFTSADIRIVYAGGVPYAEAMTDNVHLQDYGSAMDSQRNIYFDALGWAPIHGYSSSGQVELIDGHVYAVRLANEPAGETHYAKFAVVTHSSDSVEIVWAYQLVDNWPELKAPAQTRETDGEWASIRF